MPVGYNKRCKICNSEFRAQVEVLHENGSSLQQIVDFLAKKGLSVSKPGVKNHFDTHFAPKDEAAKRYFAESETIMEQAVEKRLTDLQMLDATIQSNFELHQGAVVSIKESLSKEFPVILSNGKPMLDPDNDFKPVMRKFPPSKPMVDLLNGTAAEIRQAIKLKTELLGDSDENPLKVMIVDDIDDDS